MGHAYGHTKHDVHGLHLLSLVTAPAVSPVTLVTAKAHLRVDFTDDDTIIQDYIDAATAVAQEQLGKVIITQTWDEATANPFGKVYLTKKPFQSLTSITYFDEANTSQTADLADFIVVANEDFAYVEPVTEWPRVYDRADAVTFRYVAGFGDAPADVPANIRQAILLLVGQYYEVRENLVDSKMQNYPKAFDALIDLSRVAWYG